jgi:protein TonB
MLAAKENDYRNYGLIGTVVFHGGLVGLFLLMMFKGPNPPLEGGGTGIELNYGVIGEEGSGDIQTTAQANDSQNKEDSRPAAATPDQAQPQQQTAVAQKAVEATPDRVVTGVEESGVNVKEVETPKKVEEAQKEVKAVEKPKSLYPGKSTAQNGANGTAGSSNTPTGNNNGDRPGKVGDQGNPEGTLNSKALYGTPGKGDGVGKGSLHMPGWAFDRPPKPNDDSNESGRIVFDIKVDKEGTIYYCVARETNVSSALTKLYKDAVLKTSLSPTNASGDADAGASGTVTFIISSR